MSRRCRNEPIADVDLARRMRAALRASLEQHEPPPAPDVAYAAAFGRILDPSVHALVARATTLRGRSGYVYVYRDVRDEPNVVKIGRTIELRRRQREWRRALHARRRELGYLFTARTRNAARAEAIIHAALACEHEPRVRADTGELLTEYFRIDDLDGLELFVRAIAATASRL